MIMRIYFYISVNNVTFMCSKVKLTDGTIPSDGCYKEKVVEGYQREMCLCTSSNGVYPPCNNSLPVLGYPVFVTLCVLLHFVLKFF